VHLRTRMIPGLHLTSQDSWPGERNPSFRDVEVATEPLDLDFVADFKHALLARYPPQDRRRPVETSLNDEVSAKIKDKGSVDKQLSHISIPLLASPTHWLYWTISPNSLLKKRLPIWRILSKHSSASISYSTTFLFHHEHNRQPLPISGSASPACHARHPAHTLQIRNAQTWHRPYSLPVTRCGE
jgi:hypothetical protein